MIQNREIKKFKSKAKIDLVFSRGKLITSGSLTLHYLNKYHNLQNLEVGVGISKKVVLSATRRNRIKRQINGVIQRHKLELLNVLPDGLYMIVYKGNFVVGSKSICKDLKGVLEYFKAQFQNT